MSNTRRSSNPGTYHQNRYMSDPALAEQRGLLGNLVAERAALFISRAKRELLFFLQGESLKDGGLKRVAQEIVDMFPERLGSPTMHKAGMGKRQYSEADSRDIQDELHPGRMAERSLSELYDKRPLAKLGRLTPGECLDECRGQARRELASFLADLCLNPRLNFRAPGADSTFEEFESEEMGKTLQDEPGRAEIASVPYFRDVIGALFEYQEMKRKAAGARLVMTDIARTIFETMEFAAASRGLAVINGNARIGKSTAAEAWCDMNPGRSRYVSLVDVPDDAGFLRPIARALGLAHSYTRKAAQMRERIADTLQKSGLVLVLDEAHYLYPDSLRPTALPRRINWIMTALCNYRVPVVMVCTPQFIANQKRVEKYTGWTSEQLKGRIKRFVDLPGELQAVDLEAIARFHVPEADRAIIAYLVGYAESAQTHVAGMVNAIAEARYDAGLKGRTKLTYADIKRAIEGPAQISTAAQCKAFEEQKPRHRHAQARFSRLSEETLHSVRRDSETPFQRGGTDRFSSRTIPTESRNNARADLATTALATSEG